MASPMLLDLDLPAGNIGATSLGTHARHLALCLACSGLKSFMEKTGSLTTNSVSILTAEMKKTDRALSETAQRLLTDRA